MPSLVRNFVRLQWPFDIRPIDTQICRRFKVHDLITCESKVQVVVSLDPAIYNEGQPLQLSNFRRFAATAACNPPDIKCINAFREKAKLYFGRKTEN